MMLKKSYLISLLLLIPLYSISTINYSNGVTRLSNTQEYLIKPKVNASLINTEVLNKIIESREQYKEEINLLNTEIFKHTNTINILNKQIDLYLDNEEIMSFIITNQNKQLKLYRENEKFNEDIINKYSKIIKNDKIIKVTLFGLGCLSSGLNIYLTSKIIDNIK